MFTVLSRAGDAGIRRLVHAQTALLPAGVLAGVWARDLGTGVAVGYGMLVALAVSLVLWRRERQARQHPEWDQHRLFRYFVLTGVERLAVLSALLAVGMAVMNLPPLPQLLGLVLSQFAWFVVAGRTITDKKPASRGHKN